MINGRVVQVFLLLSCASSINAQSTGASMTTRHLDVLGIPDTAGNIYGTGGASVGQFAVTPGAAQTQPGGGTCFDMILNPYTCTDAYISKVDPTGKVVFATWLGGPQNDYGRALAVDSKGNIYVTGTTGGSFPTTLDAAIPASPSSVTFAAKLSADGSKFLYSTYLPSTIATTSGIAVDSEGDAYIVGKTLDNHASVTKLSSDGSAVVFTKELAGSKRDSAAGITIDPAGNAVVVGETSSPDFPVSADVVQPVLAGTRNAFVTKLDPSGQVLFSTYLGGSAADSAQAVQTDAAGNIYVAGAATSTDFPVTEGTFEPSPVVSLWNTSPGGFVAKLSPDGSQLAYGSYVMTNDGSAAPPIGYRGPVGVTALAVTASGDAYVSGITGAGFPITQSAAQPCFGNTGNQESVQPTDIFVLHLTPDGALGDATYTGSFYAGGISVAEDGSILLTSTNSSGPAVSRIRFGSAGWSAAPCISPEVLNSATFSGFSGTVSVSPGELVSLTGFGIGPVAGVAYQPDAQGRPPLTLAGVTVLFNGQPAPLLYVQSRQINAVAPFELSTSLGATITVQYADAALAPISVQVTGGVPGLFRLQPGVSATAAAVNQDGTINGPSNPAPSGSVVSFWGTGFGPLANGCSTGSVNPPEAVDLADGYGVFFSQNYPILYAGSAPMLLCGVVQLNVQVSGRPGEYFFAPMATFVQGNSFWGWDTLIGSSVFVK